jgi:hypothetical protein
MRHVKAAASAARFARRSARSRAVRWAAVAIASAGVFGTGGIAVAGGLSAQIQAVVADMARALPVPLDIPYPKVNGAAGEGSADVNRGNQDHTYEDQVDSAESESSPPPTLSPVSVEGQDETPGVELDPAPGRDRDLDGCDLRELWDDDEGRDADRVEELRAEIRRVCGFDILDPPEWVRDRWVESSGGDTGDSGVETSDSGNDDIVDDDRGRDERRDRGGDFDSSDSERSDETKDNETDEREERHEHDEDDDEERSSEEERRDRHERAIRPEGDG